MGRRKNPVQQVLVRAYIPEPLKAHLDLYLYSELEECVPHGAYSKFFERLLREFLTQKGAKT